MAHIDILADAFYKLLQAEAAEANTTTLLGLGKAMLATDNAEDAWLLAKRNARKALGHVVALGIIRRAKNEAQRKHHAEKSL